MAVEVAVSFALDQRAMQRELFGTDGLVTRELDRRANLVVNAAKKRAPVDTGRLRSSITKTHGTTGSGLPAVFIGTNVKYAPFIIGGTGIFGPHKRPIVPKNATFLVFTPKGSRSKVFAKQVRGVRPNPFLLDALQAAKG